MRGWEAADAGVLAGADAVFDPGVHAVGGVDAGHLTAPVGCAGGQVGDPQGVPPAVCGFEQGQLGAGMWVLAAGKDPHGGGPGGELVPGRALAQQGGQLTDVSFLDPALTVAAATVGAGVISAALADLVTVIDGDLPGVPGDGGDRGAFPLAQLPAHGVGELVAAAGGQRIQPLDQPVAGPGPIRGDHQPPPVSGGQRGDRRVQDFQVIGGGAPVQSLARPGPVDQMSLARIVNTGSRPRR